MSKASTSASKAAKTRSSLDKSVEERLTELERIIDHLRETQPHLMPQDEGEAPGPEAVEGDTPTGQEITDRDRY